MAAQFICRSALVNKILGMFKFGSMTFGNRRVFFAEEADARGAG